jgi:hypothetical protein
MAQRKKQKADGILGAAAQAIGTALGTIAVRTGMATPAPKKKATVKKKAAAKTKPARKTPAGKA